MTHNSLYRITTYLGVFLLIATIMFAQLVSADLMKPNERAVGVEIVKSNLSIKDKIANLSNGRLAEIKVMPSVASKTAIEALKSLNFTIELKEVAKVPIYEAQVERNVSILGFIKAKERTLVRIDAETGKISIIKPWWSFMASELKNG